jgi:hypothetical protein
MKNRFPRFVVIVAVLALGLNLYAQPPTRNQAGQSANSSTPANASAASGLLNQAYTALKAADHDYQGHRMRAMWHIEAAAKSLGVTLQGDGQGQEAQATSDQQLHTAQGLLKQAVTDLPGKAKFHVEKAIEQLSVALTIN